MDADPLLARPPSSARRASAAGPLDSGPLGRGPLHRRTPEVPALDPRARYALAPDLAVVLRGPNTVQLGIESSRRVLVTDLRAEAAAVLRLLHAPRPLAEVLRVADDDPAWPALLARLAADGFLVRAGKDTGSRGPAAISPMTPERLTLTHRYGPADADRLLAQRADAVVVIEGQDATATALVELLDAGGIGRVYRPTRIAARRSGTMPGAAASVSADGADAAGADAVGANTVASPTIRSHTVASHAGPADPRPPAVLQQHLPPALRHRYPPSHTPPDLVVLAGARTADQGRAAELVAAMVPHLAVRSGIPRGIVGPLVLPGRSACLNCLDRHRADRDPDWRAVAATAPHLPPTPLMTQSVAGLAARQVLDWIDGMHRPASMDATLECDAGRLGPARRSWPPHPDCGCHLLGRA